MGKAESKTQRGPVKRLLIEEAKTVIAVVVVVAIYWVIS